MANYYITLIRWDRVGDYEMHFGSYRMEEARYEAEDAKADGHQAIVTSCGDSQVEIDACVARFNKPYTPPAPSIYDRVAAASRGSIHDDADAAYDEWRLS